MQKVEEIKSGRETKKDNQEGKLNSEYVMTVLADKGYYQYEDLKDEDLSWIDVLIDGPYIEEQRDISLKMRGSKNQNIIYLQK